MKPERLSIAARAFVSIQMQAARVVIRQLSSLNAVLMLHLISLSYFLSWESPQRGCPKKLHLDRTLDLSKDMSLSVLDMSWTYHIFALHVSGLWTLVWGH